MGFLSGKKTYIVGLLTIVAAVAAYATGSPVPGAEVVLDLPELAQLVVTAVLGMTIRHGVKTTRPKIVLDEGLTAFNGEGEELI